uniref:Uncharacterized protein n=1 Tax=Macaca nemestrina TaxID=9545 RepID=A0A2K6E0Q1_MACNE
MGGAGPIVTAEGMAALRQNRQGTKNWPDESFDEVDNTLANIRADYSNIDKILEAPNGQDECVWKYEHLRQLCLDECHPDTCTQMTWIFLCAAHKTPKECPAVDYTRHTLNGAACLLKSNKYFSSRVSIKKSSVVKPKSVCREIYRIFSHVYFPSSADFIKYVMKYNLMSKDNLIVPILEEEVQNSSSGESEA